MASPHDDREDDGTEDDEEKELEKMRHTLREKKKAVLEKTKEADRELWELTQKEKAIQEKQQQIRAEKTEVGQLRHELERVKSENAKLRELQDKQAKSLDETAARASESGRNIERLEVELKEKIAACERDHGGGAVDANEMKEELDTLRRLSVRQRASLRKLKDAMQRITSYSNTQQRRVASLEDEIAALRQISAETQQRQLNEIGSTFFANTQHQQQQQQQQQHKGKANFHVLVFYYRAACNADAV